MEYSVEYFFQTLTLLYCLDCLPKVGAVTCTNIMMSI